MSVIRCHASFFRGPVDAHRTSPIRLRAIVCSALIGGCLLFTGCGDSEPAYRNCDDVVQDINAGATTAPEKCIDTDAIR